MNILQKNEILIVMKFLRGFQIIIEKALICLSINELNNNKPTKLLIHFICCKISMRFRK